jgi:hypothetical protein
MKKRLLAIVLAMTVVFAYSAVGVFAEGEQQAVSGEAAKLVKYLQVAEGVTDPEASFEFDVKQVSSGNTAADAAVDSSKDFTYTMSGLAKLNDSTNYEKAVSIDSLFDGYTFATPGKYAFEVTEKSGTYSCKENEKMTYDSSKYTITMAVDQNKNITKVIVQNGDGEKVDPTTTEVEENEETGAVTSDGFVFVNNYEKTVSTHEEPQDPENPEDPDNPDKPLTKDGAFDLAKILVGQYADKDKEFNFTLTVKLPKNNTGTYNVDTTKALKGGENYNVATLPVGTEITVAETEAGQDGYTTTWASSASDNGVTVLVGENGAYVKCTNTFDDNSTTPTGIIINNLPYVLVILIAIAGIAVFARKRRYE